MASRSVNRKVPRRSDRRTANIKATHNGGVELDSYIKEFIANSLKLQEELMVNHEAIAAARREYVEEFRNKRHTSHR